MAQGSFEVFEVQCLSVSLSVFLCLCFSVLLHGCHRHSCHTVLAAHGGLCRAWCPVLPKLYYELTDWARMLVHRQQLVEAPCPAFI